MREGGSLSGELGGGRTTRWVARWVREGRCFHLNIELARVSSTRKCCKGRSGPACQPSTKRSRTQNKTILDVIASKYVKWRSAGSDRPARIFDELPGERDRSVKVRRVKGIEVMGPSLLRSPEVWREKTTWSGAVEDELQHVQTECTD